MNYNEFEEFIGNYLSELLTMILDYEREENLTRVELSDLNTIYLKIQHIIIELE